MAKIKLNGDTSGYIEISAPAVSGNNTLELGPGTKILTNLDNTFTGVSTFTSGLHVTGGSFGLGTDNPASKLEVKAASAPHITSVYSTTDHITMTTGGSGGGLNITSGNHFAINHQPFADRAGDTNLTERFRITSDGKVAIGFNAPAVAGLSIANSSTSLGFEFDTASGFAGGPTIRGYHRPSTAYKSLGITGADIKFGINDVEKLRLDSNGYLGLNNSAPHNQYYNNLVIGDGSASGDKGITIRTQSSNEGVIAFSDADSGAARYAGKIAYNHSTNAMMFFTTNGDERLRITSAGDVGIGENSPADRLVVQKANASGDVAVRIKNDTLTDGSASTPTTASLYLNTSTGDFNSFYIQARRYDNDTHFGYSNPRDGGHTPNMIISNEGRITMPNQPAFSVRRNGNQTIPHQTNTKVQWNTEIFDVGGNFDSSTNYRFTAPVAGKYLFLGHLYVYSTYQVEAKIYKNGSIYKRFSGPLGTGSNDNPNGADFMDIVDLSVNDFIEIFALQARTGDSSNVAIYGGNEKETSFVGYLLG